MARRSGMASGPGLISRVSTWRSVVPVSLSMLPLRKGTSIVRQIVVSGIVAVLTAGAAEAVYGSELPPVHWSYPGDTRKVEDLTIRSAEMTVRWIATVGGNGDFVLLKGTLPKPPQWKLLFRKQEVPRTEQGEFELSIPAESRQMRIKLIVQGPDQPLLEEDILIGVGEAASSPGEKAELKDEASKARSFGALLGVTSYHYAQTGYGTFTGQLLGAGGSWESKELLPDPRWTLRAAAFFGGLSFGGAPSGATVRFFNFNGEVGLRLPVLRSPWEFTLWGGPQASVMWLSGSEAGYKPLFFPAVYPEMRHHFKNGAKVFAHFSFVPLGASLARTSESAVHLGLGFEHPWKKGLPVKVLTEYRSIQFAPAVEESVTNRTLSVSLGAAF